MSVFGAVGSQLTFWQYRNSSGYGVGTNKAMTNGQNSGAGRLYGINTVGLQIPAPRNIVISGDNGVFGAIKVPAADVPSGTIVANAKDPVFASGSQGSLVDSLGGNDLTIDGIPCPTFQQMIIINNSPAIDSNGTAGWLIDFFMNITAHQSDGDASDGTARQFTASLLGAYSTKFPWGKALTTLLNGATKAIRAQLFAPYPLTMHTLVRNTGVTSVTLNETPAGATAALVPAFTNGVAMTYASSPSASTEYAVDPTTKALSIGAAGTPGDILTVPYFFVPQC